MKIVIDDLLVSEAPGNVRRHQCTGVEEGQLDLLLDTGTQNGESNFSAVVE